ncbi:MAG TPA: hypothetical protein VH797_00620 [Nitrososphaeraceae archaeon]
MTNQGKAKRFQIKDNQYKREKKYNLNFSKESLDRETELVKRKQEEEKARKRSRGPYRKSNAN